MDSGKFRLPGKKQLYQNAYTWEVLVVDVTRSSTLNCPSLLDSRKRSNEDIAKSGIEQLYLEVRLSPGDTLVWEIEPLPDNYTREILRF